MSNDSNRRVIVMSGVSGVGKSTHVGKLILEYIGNSSLAPLTINQILAVMPKDDPRATVTYCSADTFFMKDGEYKFNPAELANAHSMCFRNFIRAVQSGKVELVVVDNTNLTSEEIAPYMLGASAFGYEAEIITLRPLDAYFLDRLHARNTHGVSKDTIDNQYDQLEQRRLMPWWKNTDIIVSV